MGLSWHNGKGDGHYQLGSGFRVKLEMDTRVIQWFIGIWSSIPELTLNPKP